MSQQYDPQSLEDGRAFHYDGPLKESVSESPTPTKHRGSSAIGAPLSQTATNLTITPEVYEALFLNPQNRVKGDLRKTFANPTPLGILGFCVGLTPLSIELMGWRGSGGSGVATTTASIWFGGLLVILAGLGEWILGNTLSFIVFMAYGAHFLTWATTFMPFYDAIQYYGTPGTMTTGPIQFYASYAFYPTAMACLSFIFLICSLRTNLVFVCIFICATLGFALGAGSFFTLALGEAETAKSLVVATGAAFFAGTMFAWYLFASLMLAIVEFPLPTLPVFDLGHIVKAKKKPSE